MRTVCIYTEQHCASVDISKRCVESGKDYGIDVEPYTAIYYSKMNGVHLRYGLTLKYKPVNGCKADFEAKTMSRTRMANGTTHYLLYRWSIKNDEAVHILEHDSTFIGQPPKPIYDGVIQTSSHTMFQQTPMLLLSSNRAKRQKQKDPGRAYDMSWDSKPGVIRHPLAGTFGTSGYIIGPGAAAKMVEYIERDGIANADRIRSAHIGEGNLYLQVPQSVFCDHLVKSHLQ